MFICSYLYEYKNETLLFKILISNTAIYTLTTLYTVYVEKSEIRALPTPYFQKQFDPPQLLTNAILFFTHPNLNQ